MKHKYWFLAILALVGAAAWVVATKPTKQGLDLKGGLRVILRGVKEDGKPPSRSDLESAKNIIARRVNGLGVSEPVVQTKGTDQIVVELPDVPREKQEEAKAQFQKLALLRFIKIPEKYQVSGSGDTTIFLDKTTQKEVSAKDVLAEAEQTGGVIVTGRELLPQSSADIGKDGSSIVYLKFNADGRKKFADFTLRNVKKYFGIFLDDDPISVPVIEEPIPSGDGIIHGQFTLKQAQNLADLLNAGALPIKLNIDTTSEVGPTLGQSSIHASILAGVIGLLLVAVFMIGYYRLPGAVAVVALLFYSTFVFALFKLIPVYLTLPGIAGFILSIGMAVDANILIFERLKEELRSGKTLRAAIDAGFSRAFPSILDSNACTLITCVVLLNFGTGAIKGFALTLAIGVLVSMFTAITCTRTMLYLLVGSGVSQNPKLWGLGTDYFHREEGRELKVVEHRNIYFLISGLIILPGLAGMLYLFSTTGSPVLRGIDFTGGSMMELQYTKQMPTVAQVHDVLAGVGRGDSTIDVSTVTKTITIRSAKAFPSDATAAYAERQKIEQGLVQATGIKEGDYKVAAFDNVGPVMGKEMTRGAILSVVLASLLIIVYLGFRFAGAAFGTTAVIAMIHDVLVLLGLFAIFGIVRHWQVDSLFVTAALTVIGFSVHDTIVVFDRIRENLKYRQRGESFDLVANRSVTQTLARSINTSFTVVLVLTALVAFGGASIREFNVALLIGIISGTYSSVFNATPLLAMWRAHQRKQAQLAARRPDEKPMMALQARPQPKPRPAPKPALVAGDGEGVGDGSVDRTTAVGIPATGVKAAPKPQRNIKKKKRRY